MMLIAVLAAPLVFYIPGLALSYALGWAADAMALERHYERIVVSMLLSGWLTLLLATGGLFSPGLLLFLLACISAAIYGWSRQRGIREDRRYPIRRSGWSMLQRGVTRPSGARADWATVAFAVIGIVTLVLVMRPFEMIPGARDAGVYANTGFAIAHTGHLVQHDALLAEIGQAAQSSDPALREPAQQALSNFLGVQNRQRYIATRMRTTGFFINEGELAIGRVVPQFLHLFPAWIGLLTSMAGMYAGLAAPGVMGFMGAWSVGMLGRRLAGSAVGVLAFLLLALNSVQVWFARYSTAETTAQFLTFASLYFFARFQQLDTQSQHRSLVGYAAIAGVAAGQLALTRIDWFLVIGPLLLYLLYTWVTRRWRAVHLGLALGLGAMLLHAALHVVFVARAYFFDTSFERLRDYALTAHLALPFLTESQRETFSSAGALTSPTRLWLEMGLLLLLLLVLLAVRRWPGPLHALEGWLWRRRPLLLGAAALGIVCLAAYAYLVRPRIIDADMLFNTREGWNDPLLRDPRLVQEDVNEWRMTIDTARQQAGVVLLGDAEYAATAIDFAATETLRAQLRAERGPWHGPFSNQTFNWIRLQGYVGAPIALPRIFWDDGKEWWREYARDVPPGVQPPTGLPLRDKETIPLANLVRVGWYLSPPGVVLGVLGFALWWRRGMSRAAWLLLLIGLVGTFFYVRQTYGTSDQSYIYILRRYVPVTYPVFSLGMAYALATLMGFRALPPSVPDTVDQHSSAHNGTLRAARHGMALAGWMGACMLVTFFVWTGRPIYAHTEYAGAVEQIAALSRRFEPEAVLLFRGGGPVYHLARDVPEIVVTPLRFGFERHALTVKSTYPGRYADALAAQVGLWQAQGRPVYLVLSASGGNFMLPGFAIETVGQFTLSVPEFEQLTNQKPRNVATLHLPFTIYRLLPGEAGTLAAIVPPLTTSDVAAQVQGFHLAEPLEMTVAATQGALLAADATFAWTNGDALLRLAWPDEAMPRQIELRAAGGVRPAHLGAAHVCLSLLPESEPWPGTADAMDMVVDLGCVILGAEMANYRVPLPMLPGDRPATGSMLLRLSSPAWVPAAEDPHQRDQRAVGIQFGGLMIR